MIHTAIVNKTKTRSTSSFDSHKNVKFVEVPRPRPFGAQALVLLVSAQAGHKVKALKCLIRSGDTDKIVFFAGVSRNAEIYTLAANYLQTLDWHSTPHLAQSVVSFYTKVWNDAILISAAPKKHRICVYMHGRPQYQVTLTVPAMLFTLKVLCNMCCNIAFMQLVQGFYKPLTIRI